MRQMVAQFMIYCLGDNSETLPHTLKATQVRYPVSRFYTHAQTHTDVYRWW